MRVGNVTIKDETHNEGLKALVKEKGEKEAAAINRRNHIMQVVGDESDGLAQLAADIDALPEEDKKKITLGVVCALALRAAGKL